LPTNSNLNGPLKNGLVLSLVVLRSWSLRAHGDVLACDLLLGYSSSVVMGVIVRSVRTRQLWHISTKLNSSVTLHQKSLRFNSALFKNLCSATAVSISKVCKWLLYFPFLTANQHLRQVTCAWWKHVLIHAIILRGFHLLLTAVLGRIMI